jgi:hypothetical protein
MPRWHKNIPQLPCHICGSLCVCGQRDGANNPAHFSCQLRDRSRRVDPPAHRHLGVAVSCDPFSFGDRGAQMTDLEKLLVDNRLVTLTGAGGAGKTRLGVEIAARIAAEFGDGVCGTSIWRRSPIPAWCRSRWPARWACPTSPAAPRWTRCCGLFATARCWW